MKLLFHFLGGDEFSLVLQFYFNFTEDLLAW